MKAAVEELLEEIAPASLRLRGSNRYPEEVTIAVLADTVGDESCNVHGSARPPHIEEGCVQVQVGERLLDPSVAKFIHGLLQALGHTADHGLRDTFAHESLGHISGLSLGDAADVCLGEHLVDLIRTAFVGP